MANKKPNSNKSKFSGKGDKLQGRQIDTDAAPFRGQSKLNKQNSSKAKREAEEFVNTGERLSRGNPVQFYTKFDTFAQDVARLPFSSPLGQKWNFRTFSGSTTPTENSWIAPGMMRVRFIPTIGVSEDFNSPINRSSIRFYTYLRSNQKASGTYDHQDVTFMEVSLDSCYMFHALMSKIYAVVNQFTPLNEYFSRATIQLCGVDFEDIRHNLQDFRAYINAFAYQLGQYAMPNNVTLFDRHRWMCEGLYADSTSTRAQTYMFVPEGFWLYDNTVSTGSQCTFKRWLNAGNAVTAHTFAEIVQFGTTLLNAVSNDEDFAIISGDIYNFYGGDVYKLPYIDESYSVLPVYDETVMSQIENAISIPVNDSSLVITQNPSVNQGAIIFKPTALGFAWYDFLPMNFHHDSPTSDQVIEASRLMCALGTASNGSSSLPVATCGTEIVCGLDIITRSPSTGALEQFHNTNTMLVADDTSNFSEVISNLMLYAQFDWAPQVTAWYSNADGSRSFLGTNWDVDNYAQIPVGYLENIHLACLLSLFKVGTNRES